MVQDLDGGCRTLRLDVCRVNRDVAGAFQPRKHAFAHEQLADLPDPVFAEGGLHAVNDRAAEPYAHVHDALLRARFSQPAVDDAMAADEGDSAVDDRQLAVIPLVEDADIGEGHTMKLAQLAAGLHELLLHALAHATRSIGIEQHADIDAGPDAPDQRLREARAKLALLPEESLEMHRAARLADLLHQGVEERPVLQHFDAVSFDHRAESQPGQ